LLLAASEPEPPPQIDGAGKVASALSQTKEARILSARPRNPSVTENIIRHDH
jgi:hypothetical protein